MKNVTITLPEDLARWLRVRAAEDDRSVSGGGPSFWRRCVAGEDEYEVAMKAFMAVKPRRMDWVDGRKPIRDDLHNRAGFC